jgi:lysophospholipase L1-like esterase
MKKILSLSLLYFSLIMSCSSSEEKFQINDSEIITNDPESVDDPTANPKIPNGNYKILALGDSYTIGESVCDTCRFPEQLKDSLALKLEGSTFDLDIIARTGWTTTNLINAINNENPTNDYDLVTLLIGVNNQYQNKPFSVFTSEFPQLLDKAIALAKGDKTNVIVISIPDYAYTPFGQSTSNPTKISDELNTYNDFAGNYSNQKEVSFVYITDITRQGLINPELVASDGLHPSKVAYTKFVEQLRPVAMEKLE